MSYLTPSAEEGASGAMVVTRDGCKILGMA